MTLILDLPPELEHRLATEAARRQQALEECARALLSESLPSTSLVQQMAPEERESARDNYAGLQRGSQEDLMALARSQGAPLAVTWDALPRDPAPEEDGADDFLTWLYGLPLVTHNPSDYAGVTGLTVISEPGP